ncbi:adenylate kinase family enzyme [Mucilaginibacter gracilis]|uniref:Adenylate kinase family enzyme n=1 Tax=Mucilaginibacter gracilis TaxID=423350 RepID=A0A495J8H8_9SPHI|nr:adenylate kinase [Mucilaginibacter gracilis]RKR85296.1 adenylate kinase family enzyme [Mucilaginibacter gracilis]
MKIHIFGASGSGVTTLGLALAEKTGYPYFDADQFFWEKSNPPFTIRRDAEERNALLHQQLAENENWILGGSIVQWGDSFPPLFDLTVFLLIPHDVRIARLKQREFERYGDIIFTDELRNKQYQDFIIWASGYDDNTTISPGGRGMGRTLQVHREWIKKLNNGFLEISGDTTVKQRLDFILNSIKHF